MQHDDEIGLAAGQAAIAYQFLGTGSVVHHLDGLLVGAIAAGPQFPLVLAVHHPTQLLFELDHVIAGPGGSPAQGGEIIGQTLQLPALFHIPLQIAAVSGA